MPEEEDDDDKKGKGKKDKKDKKEGKDDKKDKGGKDKVKSPGKDSKKGSHKGSAKGSGKGSHKGSAKGSAKGSPKAEKAVEESSDKKAEKSDKSEKSEKSDKSEKSEKNERDRERERDRSRERERERPEKMREKSKKQMLGPYKAPPPSETMLRAMAEQGPVYAERIYNDEYEDEEEGRNYVEVQMYQRRSGTNISEGGGVVGGGGRGQTFYVDVPPPRPPRPPAYDNYYPQERPPPRRELSERLEQQSTTQQCVYYDDGSMQQRQQTSFFEDYEPVGPAGPPPRQEPRRPIMLPPTTVVVNLSESGAPPPPGGGGAVGPPARVSGYDLRQPLNTRASMRSREEFRAPQRVQQSDLQVRNGPPMSTLLTQQLREIALQNQMPMDENVVSSTERVIYECIRKMESSTSDSSEDRPPDTIVKASGMLGPNQPGAMSPMSPQRAVMTPQGIMSPVGPPGMMRGPTPGMIRSPISAGSRGYLPRVPSGPLRVITPRMPVQYPQRWPPSARATPLTPASRGGRRDDDGMTLFPERSLIMLLVFLFLFVLVVVILAISGMNFPGLSKGRNHS